MFAETSSSAGSSRTFGKNICPEIKGKLCVSFGKWKDLGLSYLLCYKTGFDGLSLTF